MINTIIAIIKMAAKTQTITIQYGNFVSSSFVKFGVNAVKGI